MASLIQGTDVVLFERVQEGVDDFQAPVYREVPVVVHNVLVSPVSSEDVISSTQLYGKHAVYELSIPKSDGHIWEDRKVEFFGQSFRTFGFCKEWIAENVPLDWNRKVLVERYG